MVIHGIKELQKSKSDSERDISKLKNANVNLPHRNGNVLEIVKQQKYLKPVQSRTGIFEEDQESKDNFECPPVSQRLNIKELEACGEWTSTCQSECLCEEERQETSKVPKVVHFIKDENLTFSDWLAIAAAKKYIKPIRINLFIRQDVSPNCWMRRLNVIGHVRILKLSPEQWLENLNNITVSYVEHQSDLLRNAILYHYGGIYMDTDAYATKSFDPLLSNYSVVLGRNLVDRIGNGLIVAKQRSCLICEYASEACESFDGSWTKHSTASLSNLVNTTVTDYNLLVLNYSSGFFPFSWKKKHFHQLFDEDSAQVPFSPTQVYALHLFGSKFPDEIAERFSDLEWINGSPSILATHIRTLINSQLLDSNDLDEALCVDLSHNLIT